MMHTATQSPLSFDLVDEILHLSIGMDGYKAVFGNK